MLRGPSLRIVVPRGVRPGPRGRRRDAPPTRLADPRRGRDARLGVRGAALASVTASMCSARSPAPRSDGNSRAGRRSILSRIRVSGPQHSLPVDLDREVVAETAIDTLRLTHRAGVADRSAVYRLGRGDRRPERRRLRTLRAPNRFQLAQPNPQHQRYRLVHRGLG